jgi:hypothetical protein
VKFTKVLLLLFNSHGGKTDVARVGVYIRGFGVVVAARTDIPGLVVLSAILILILGIFILFGLFSLSGTRRISSMLAWTAWISFRLSFYRCSCSRALLGVRLDKFAVRFLQHAEVSDDEATLDIVDVLLILRAQEWTVVEVKQTSVGICVVVELDIPFGFMLDLVDAVNVRV